MLVLPNFHKSETVLHTILDQWMYLMKHLHKIDSLPNYLDKRIFSCVPAIGELTKLTPEEKMTYISSLDRKRDYNNTIAYAEKQGIEKGKKEGLSVEQIAKITKLTVKEIEAIK